MNSLTRYGVIYKLTNTINGKSYIGQTVDFVSRMSSHKTGHDSGTYLSNAVEKYGWEVFAVEKLYEGFYTYEQLNALECQAIQEHKTKRPHGYNLTDGGQGAPGYVMTEEHRRKIGDATRGKPRPAWIIERMRAAKLGSKASDESRRRMSEAHKGKKLSEEQKKKISEFFKGRTGKPATEETRRKLSESHKGKKWTDQQREKMKIALTGRKYPGRGKGVKRSEEAKQRIRDVVTAWWAKKKAEKGQ